MRRKYLAVVWCLVYLAISPLLFAVKFDRSGVYFAGRSASFVVKDGSSVVNLRSEPETSWQCFSVVKDCSDSVSSGVKSLSDDDDEEPPCWGCCDLMKQNSYAIIKQEVEIDNNSWAIISLLDCCELAHHNSWAINIHNEQITNNSYAINNDHELTIDNSWAIISLLDCCELAHHNSWAINWHDVKIFNNSIAINNDHELTVDNSWAIINLGGCCELAHQNSWAINLHDVKILNNSIAIDHDHELTVDNSYAIKAFEECCELAHQNSRAINFHEVEITNNRIDIDLNRIDIDLNRIDIDLNRVDIDLNITNILNNSIAIDHDHELTVDNSNAIKSFTDCCELAHQNSWAINLHDVKILNNSIAIDHDHELTVDNSYAIKAFEECCELAHQNSRAINFHEVEITNNRIDIDLNRIDIDLNRIDIDLNRVDIDLNITNILNNSIAIDHDHELTVDNSNAIKAFEDCCELAHQNSWAINLHDVKILNNSIAIDHDHELTVDNSYAIKAFEECCELAHQNSRAINFHEVEITNNRIDIDLNRIDIDLNRIDIDLNRVDIDLNITNILNNSIAIDHDHELTVDNSNAIKSFTDCCELAHQNSWAINLHDVKILNNSIAIDHDHELTVDNSYAIKAFEECCELAHQNSRAINFHEVEITNNRIDIDLNRIDIDLNRIDIDLNRVDIDLNITNILNNSIAIDHDHELTVDNSNAIKSFTDCCELAHQNSWAINLHDVKILNNSIAIDHDHELTVDNSYAIKAFEECCELAHQNSWAINLHDVKILNNSIAIDHDHELTVDNSYAIKSFEDCCELAHHNSWAINIHNEQIINNSYAIDNDHELTVDNSWAIISLQKCCENGGGCECDCCELVYQNSYAIIHDHELTVDNSWAIISLQDCCENGGGECECDDGCNPELIGAPITTNIALTRSCHLHLCDQVVVDGEVTINGQGMMVVFSDPDCPQFIVNPEACVTLENIILKQINSGTFDIAPCAKIKIGKNVLFELSENVTIESGKIELVDADGQPNLFTVRGMGGVKQLNFITNPCCRDNSTGGRGGYRELDPDRALNLNYHTMLLQDVELLGVKHVANSTAIIGSEKFIGSIGLGGGAIVNVEDSNGLGYVVEGLNNELRLLENNLTFDGSLTFGDHFDNVLHVNAAIQDLLPDTPVVNFADDFLLVQSVGGRAGLIFDDIMITVVNQGSDSFIVGEHSFLDGYGVEILQTPVRQASTDFELGSNIMITTDQTNWVVYDPPPIFRMPLSNEEFGDRSLSLEEEKLKVTTALHLFRSLQIDDDRDDEQDDDRGGDNGGSGGVGVEEDLVARIEGEYEQGLTEQEIVSRFVEEFSLRSVDVPANVHTVYRGQACLREASGNILLRGGTITEFGVDLFRQLNVTMKDGATLSQGVKPATIKSGDTINVIGNGNTILVKDTLFLAGNLRFASGAQLKIVFDENAYNPKIVFSDETLLTLEKGVRLEFSGRGEVVFGDRTIVDCKSVTGFDRSELIFNGLVTALCSGTMTVKGKGLCKADNGARVIVESGGHLIIGDAVTDELILLFDRLAVLAAAREKASSKGGMISLHKAEVSVLFDRAATLSIEDGAEFEVNLLDGVISAGRVQRVLFDDEAKIKIGKLARLSFADNVGSLPVEWDHSQGRLVPVDGGGVVSFVETPGSIVPFSGKLPISSVLEENARTMIKDEAGKVSMVSVAKSFLQQETLAFTTVFVDGRGNRMLRTKDGVTLLLSAKDVVEEDSLGRALVNGFYV